MANIATLTVNMVVDTARFTVGLKKSKREANAFAADVKTSLTSLVALGSATFVIKGLAEAGIEMQKLERGMRAATGSGTAAAKELDFLRQESERLGLNLRGLAPNFISLTAAARGTRLEGRGVRDIFTSVAEASAVMGYSTEQTGNALAIVEKLLAKNYLRAKDLTGALNTQFPGAFQIAARSIGVTTIELEEMLKTGKIATSDLLPKLFTELRNTFGPEVENAADSTQAAINRMSNAIFNLKASIASSGVLDALATFTNAIAHLIDPTAGSGFGAEADAIGREIEALALRAAQLSAQIAGITERGPAAETGGLLGKLAAQLRGDVSVDVLIAELDQVTAKLEKLKSAQLDVLSGTGRAQRATPNRAILEFAQASAELDKVFAKMDKSAKAAFESLLKEFETTEQEVTRQLRELDAFKHLLPPEEIDRISKEIRDKLTEGIEEINLNRIRAMVRTTKRVTDEMTEVARQAARNIQDAFADFFFDPFEGGLKGMLQSFVDVIRRMVANLLASQLLKYLATLPGPFGKFFALGTGGGTGPGAALGGFRRNQPFIAGEHGPELVSPGIGSTVSKLGNASFNFTTNISGGAGMDARTLIPILEQNNRKLKAEFIDQLRRGAFA